MDSGAANLIFIEAYI